MRTTADLPRRPPRSRARIGLIGGAGLLFLLLTSLRGIAGFYTDFLWFDEVNLTSVWRGVLGAKILLGIVFTAVFFALAWLNLVIADRLAPRFRAIGPEDEIVQRYRQVVGPHAGKVRIGVSLLFALLAGAGVSSQWNSWLLYLNGVDFGGPRDPQFGKDVGFFVFQLPFLSFVVNWLLFAVVIIAVLTVVAHYLNGGIRLQAPAQRVTANVKAHISVLLGALALIKAAGYYLQRYELSFSTRGVVHGATYTDVKAQLPALELLIWISLAAFVIFLANIRRQGWVLPIVGVGLWAFISVVVGAIVPAFVQKFLVEPSEVERERPYIERNLDATRTAYGIDDVERVDFRYDDQLDARQLAANADVVRNVRLWDPEFTNQTFEKLQEIRSYYQFNDVDIDRYQIDGTETQTVLSVRELNSSDLPAQSWVNRHLLFTHGFGALVAPANAVTREGQPAFTLRNVPPEGLPEVKQPRIYYGEATGGYAIVRSKREEIDFQRLDGATQTSRYEGTGGVPMSSLIRRAAFALRFANLNPLISGLVTPQSRAIFIRDIGDRVRTAAPFLRYDADPYPVIVDGRIQWIQDAYTATARYPYAQQADTDRVPQGSGLRGGFNYVRNSVKVVIDAYHGSMKFYVVDPADPLVRAYRKAFPKLFTPASEMSPDLRAHLRYPEDLFRVQTNMFGRYHIVDPTEFYNAGDAWHISQDPGSGSPSQIRTTATTNPQTGAVGGERRARMDPTYLQLRLPGAPRPSFLILQPFVPSSESDEQQNLTAFMTASTDPGQAGLRVYVMPRGRQIDGPALVDARTQADPDIARDISLLDQRGSEVKLGNVLVLPVENSLLYVRPLYVQAARNPLPEFKKAIVVFANRAVMRDTLQEALTALFGAAPATLEQPRGGGPPPTPTTPEPGGGPAPGAPPLSGEVQGLLAQAQAAYDAAQAALRAGNLAEYERQIKTVGDLVAQARQATGTAAPAEAPPGQPPPTTTAPPTTAPSPSAA